MNCERFEELLIDFIEDEIELSDRETVKEHLAVCPYCSKKLEEYREIKRMFNEEPPPQVSPQILNRLSEIAGERVETEKKSFWKRWFYSPVLVPLLSSALALFVWISYGEKNVDLFHDSSDMYSREVMAKKTPSTESPNLPEAAGESLEGLRSQPGRTLSVEPPSAGLQAPGKSAVPEESLSASAPAPAEELSKSPGYFEYKDEASAEFRAGAMNEPISNQPTEAEEALGRLETVEEQEIRGDKEDDEGAELDTLKLKENTYRNQLDLALKQQTEGDCEASISTNKELLSASPPPPDPIREKAYLSLAGCYEQKKEWESAILNYKNLQEVAPGQADLAKKKIETLEQKNALLKARELNPPGSAEEGQVSE